MPLRAKITSERLRDAGAQAATVAMARIEREVGSSSSVLLKCVHFSKASANQVDAAAAAAPAADAAAAPAAVNIRTELTFIWQACLGDMTKELRVSARCDRVLYGHALALPREWAQWLTLTACQNALSKIGSLPWMHEGYEGNANFISLAMPKSYQGPLRCITMSERGRRLEYIICAPTTNKDLWYCHPGSRKSDAFNADAPFHPRDLKLVNLKKQWQAAARPKTRLRGRVQHKGRLIPAARAMPHAFCHLVSIAHWLALTEHCENMTVQDIASKCNLELDPWHWGQGSNHVVVLWASVHEGQAAEVHYSAVAIKSLVNDIRKAQA